MKNKVIYSAIFNNYDSLKRPKYINDDYDYVMFTDSNTFLKQKFRNDSVWRFVVLKNIENEKEGQIVAKDIKINCHKYLSDYKKSIYIDGSFTQIDDANKIWSYSKHTYFMCKHPRRDCAFKEAEICSKQRLGNMKRLEMQMSKYQKESYPKKNGLYMGGIIARHHNSKAKKINEYWWNEITNFSMRDQLSINYVLWKLKQKIGSHPYDYGIDSIFKVNKHL